MTDLEEQTAPARRRSVLGRVAGKTTAVLLVIVLLVAAGVWYLLFRSESGIASGKPVEVKITAGSGAPEIGRTLAKAGVVANSYMFVLQSRMSSTSGKLKPGTYAFKTGMPYDAVLEKLASGPDIVFYDVPIPEGFTVKQVAARFAKRAGVSEEEFLALATSGATTFSAKHPYLADVYGGSLQGYLYPATYRVKKGTSARAIIEMMLEQFDSKTTDLDLTYAQSRGLDMAQVVTIASILEREASLAKDRPVVASVIYNRLAKHMRLQLDSTVLYISPPGTKSPSQTDLFRDSPYNTYRHAGLPPGPISNPGAAALKAAANPARTGYYYYVLTSKDGSQTFTKTYAEFLKAVKVFHKVFGQ